MTVCMEPASFIMQINRKCCKILHLISINNDILHIMSKFISLATRRRLGSQSVLSVESFVRHWLFYSLTKSIIARRRFRHSLFTLPDSTALVNVSLTRTVSARALFRHAPTE